MKIHPPGKVTVGRALEDAELALADVRSSIERDLADVPQDVLDAVLSRVDAAAEKAMGRFLERLDAKLTKGQ